MENENEIPGTARSNNYAKVNELVDAAAHRYAGEAKSVAYNNSNEHLIYWIAGENGKVLIDCYWDYASGVFTGYLENTAVVFADVDKLIEWLKR